MAGDDLLVGTGIDLAGLRRDTPKVLAHFRALGGDITRAIGSRSLIPDLGDQGRDAARRLASGLASELRTGLTDTETVFRDFAGDIPALVTPADLSSVGERAGQSLATGLRRGVQREALGLRQDVSAALAPAGLGNAFTPAIAAAKSAASDVAIALGTGGVEGGRLLSAGLARGLVEANAGIVTFARTARTTLEGADLLGSLATQGERAGGLLVAGVISSVDASGSAVQRAVATALIPANLSGEMARVVGAAGTEAGGRLVASLSVTGTNAGRALVDALSAALSTGTAATVAAFARNASTSIDTTKLLGNATPVGERAGQQLVSGARRAITAGTPELQSAISTALVPASAGLTTQLASARGTITTSLAQFPALFSETGRASGSALVDGIAGELAGGSTIVATFAQETSRALTAALAIGDVSGTGTAAGRTLAIAIARGVEAEAPRIRSATTSALLPGDVAAGMGRIVDGVIGEAAQLGPALGTQGAVAGRALVQGLGAEVAKGAGVFKSLTAGTLEGFVVDSTSIRTATGATNDLRVATEGVTDAARGADAALGAIDAGGAQKAAQETRSLADAQRDWLREAQGISGASQALYARQREAVRAAATESARTARSSTTDAQQEVDARKQVRAELRGEIQQLALYGRAVDATNADAVSAWRAEAAAIRAQAREVGLSREQMLKLDIVVQDVERRFARLARTQLPNIAAPVSGATNSFALLNQQTGKFSPLAQRAGNAALAVGFALNTMAQGGDKAESGARTALRAVGALGIAFGPEGLIVSGVALTLDAILGMFDRAREEIAKTRQAAVDEARRTADELDDLQNRRDVPGLTSRRDQLVTGTSARDFKDSLAEQEKAVADFRTHVEKEIATLEARRDALTATASVDRGSAIAKADIARINTQIQRKRDELNAEEQRVDLKRLQAVEIDRRIADLRRQPVTPSQDVEALSKIIALGAATSDEFQRARGHVARLRKELAAIPVTPQTLNERAAILSQIRDLTPKVDTKDARKELDALAESVQTVIGLSRLSADQKITVPDLSTDAGKVYDRLVKAVAKFGDGNTEASLKVRQLMGELRQLDAVGIALTRQSLVPGIEGDLLKELGPLKVTALISRVDPMRFIPEIEVSAAFDPTQLSLGFKNALKAATAAQTDVDLSALVGDSSKLADANKNAANATANLRSQVAALAAGISTSTATDEQKRAALDAIRKVAQEAGVDLEALGLKAASGVRNTSALGAGLNTIADTSRGLINVLDAIGGIGPEARAQISAVVDLADAVGNIIEATGKGAAQGGLAGAIFSAATSAASVITSIISAPIEEAKQNRAILRQNNESIERLRQDLNGQSDATIQNILAGADAIRDSSILQQRALTSGFGRGFKNVEALDKELRASGSSLALLKRQADALGISIVDAKGRITAEGLAKLDEASRLSALALARFENTLDDFTFLQNARKDIFDLDGPQQSFDDAIAVLQKFTGGLGANLTGIDISTKEGRDRAEKEIRRLYELAAANLIPPELLKGLSAEQFVDQLVNADNALDTFAETANKASSEMVNVVQGFRDFNLDRAKFLAQEPVVRTVTPASDLAKLGGIVKESTTAARDRDIGVIAQAIKEATPATEIDRLSDSITTLAAQIKTLGTTTTTTGGANTAARTVVTAPAPTAKTAAPTVVYQLNGDINFTQPVQNPDQMADAIKAVFTRRARASSEEVKRTVRNLP